MKIEKQNLKKVIFVIIIIIIVVNIILSIKNFLNPKQAYLFNIKGVIIQNDSMNPEVKKGEIAITKKANIEEIEIGDVISYYEGKEAVTARVIQKQDTGIRTKADNNENYNYHYVIETDLVGKVIFTIPIYIIVIVLAIAVIIIVSVMLIRKNKCKKQ